MPAFSRPLAAPPASVPRPNVCTPRLRVSVLWVVAGNVSLLASQWAVLVLIARYGTPVMVGQFALAFAATAPLFLFSQLRLRAVQATDARDEYQAADYFSLRLLTTIAALIASFALGWVFDGGNGAFVVMAGVAVSKAFESGSDIFYGFFQRYEAMHLAATSMMLRGVLSVAVVALAMSVYKSAVAASLALAAVSFLLFAGYDLGAARGLARRLSVPSFAIGSTSLVMRRLAASAFPLGCSAMLMSLAVGVPRYFIERYAGTAAVGIFSAVAYVALASGYAVSALGDAAGPMLSRYFAAGDDAGVRRLQWRFIGLAAGLGVAAALFLSVCGEFLLGAIYGPAYEGSTGLLTWLSIAGIAANVASIASYGLISGRRFQAHLVSLTLMLAAVTGFSWWWTAAYGVEGAARALVVGYAAQAVYAVAASLRPKEGAS